MSTRVALDPMKGFYPMLFLWKKNSYPSRQSFPFLLWRLQERVTMLLLGFHLIISVAVVPGRPHLLLSLLVKSE